MAFEDSDDSSWFGDELQAHEAALRRWLTTRFPSLNCIDDIVQESLLKTIDARKQQRIRSPRSFLFRIARNLALDHFRSHRVSRTISLVENEASDVVSQETSIPEEISQKEEIEILKQAIANLPPKCREIITLHKLEGLSQKEVAEKLGISVHTVAGQIAIAFQKCTRYMESYRQQSQ